MVRIVYLLMGSAAALAGLGVVQAQGLSPEEAVARMTLPEGLAARVVAAEPLIRQPVCIEFDDRGRLWVIQYLQYPNPAGLARVKVDRYSRTVYDKVPGPPPEGPKGADRITILEDDDGDGKADRAHDFVSGLNLASGLAFGHGGVFILQVPYLLFYPDRDRDDRPDGDPEVLLTGFGMEDAHSVANSLTWGPDGWLYGLQGSTVTANVRGQSFQQGVWRYHPTSRSFELFTEGGGNMWGLDFDREGRLLASTNVGGHALLHADQGAYCWKSFGKHGALHNPYAYGYFDHAAHRGDGREGHVTVGGLLYEADGLPERFRGRYIAGDLLGHAVRWHDVSEKGSTVETTLAGDLVIANDPWFATSDLTLGPDGAVYIADWHDQRTAHPDPDAEWDRSNGRVYAVSAADAKPARRIDMAALSDEELMAALSHPNVWRVRRARKILAERKRPETMARLRDLVLAEAGSPRPIEALWALATAGELDPSLEARLLNHPDETVRKWAVRLIGDRIGLGLAEGHGPGASDEPLRALLVELAASEPSVKVRAQLAATSRRLPTSWAMEINATLIARGLNDEDPRLPLLLWWSMERDAVEHAGALRARLSRPEVARTKLARLEIVPRLVRRYAAEGSAAADGFSRDYLKMGAAGADFARLLDALDAGLRERPAGAAEPSAGLKEVVVEAWRTDEADPTTTSLAVRLGHPPALERAARVAASEGTDANARLAMVRVLAEAPAGPPVGPLLSLATGDGPLATAALDALARDDSDATAGALIAVFASRPEAWRARAVDLLLGRKSWAAAFLDAVDRGVIDPKGVGLESLRGVASHGDPALDAVVRKHWGSVTPGTPGEKLAEARRLNNDLRAGKGDAPRGREVFLKHCANCHQLFGQGKAVGPDLTTANRADNDYLLASLVDPSAVVRKEYQSTVIATRDGRVLTGVVIETGPGRLSLAGPDGQSRELSEGEVESSRDATISLMPEGLYRELSPEALRDLFAYLQSR